MNNTLRLIFLTFLFSCNSKIDNSGLIENNFYTGQAINMIKLEEIKGLSRQYYNGNPDSLLQEVDEVFALRRASGFKLGGEISDIEFPLLLPYFDATLEQFYSLQQTHLFWPDSEKKFFEEIVENARNIVESQSQSSDLLELVIAINTIDRVLLTSVRSSFSDGHELFELEFFFHESGDPRLGHPYKVFITPQIALPKSWDVIIDSVQFRRNGQIISDGYNLEILGSVGYFRFKPGETGEYELTGIYSAGIEKESVQETGKFQFTFVVE